MDINVINNVPNINVTVNQNDDGSLAIIVKEKGKPLSEYKPGETAVIGNREYIILDCLDNYTKVISKDFLYSSSFGDNNDWRKSKIREKLNGKVYKELASIVGKDNIITMTRDLTAMDGSGSYGTCEDKISLLTFDEYRKYHEILGIEINYPDWWYLITPASMRKNYARGVCYVNSSGVPFWGVCDYSVGVRPFCILKSSVLTS